MTVTMRLTVADDEPLVRSGIRLVLTADPELEVVAEAGDGATALDDVRRHRPDVALVDIRMPARSGIEVAAAVRQDPALARTRVLVLTTFADEEYVVEAVRAGASGYLLKSMEPEAFRAAVHAAARGNPPLAPELTRRLLEEYTRRRPRRSATLDRLTGRELDVLRALATGGSNAEIAARLFVAEGTVKTHVAAVLHKLGLRDRTQAVVAAYELGLVRPGNNHPTDGGVRGPGHG